MTADAFAPSGFFVLRTPLLAFSEFTAWGEGLEAAGHRDDAERLADAVARDRVRLRERLVQLLARPELREAVFLASPSLDDAIEAWRRAPDTRPARSAERSLVSYFSRATGRPTPFGLFAGCSTGTIGGRTRLRLEGKERYRRHSRLDMELLCNLAERIERHPRLRGGFVYRPNTSLYESGHRLLYAEAGDEDGRRAYRLVAVDKTPYLAATLARASEGERLDVLAAALVDGDITQADADEYLGELVDSQVLRADIGPQLTGAAPTPTFSRTLARCPPTAPLAERLDDARRRLAALDREAVGASPERYRAVARALDGLPASPELSRLVQVDLAKPGKELSLGPKVVAEIVRGVRTLHAFTTARPPDALRRFREDFVRRYDGREVPLVEALDEDSGIGFEPSGSAGAETAHLLAGLDLNGRRREQSAVWTGRDALLLDKLTDALRASSMEIAIDATELPAENRADVAPLPDAFEVLLSLDAASEEAVDRGDFRVVVHSASGPPGARLLGRFCHLDHSLHRFVCDHLRAEEANRPDCVFAEIVHLPEGRAGNILTRPVLRAYEIPYLGRSGAPAERQIHLSDLVVCVRDDRIVLRSRRLRREVIPRLTTAHDHVSRSLGVYRFLCALQHQGVVPGLVWDWGPLGHVGFLPRVVSGRAVLSRARWNLGTEEIAALGERHESDRFAAVQSLRADRGIPRYVVLSDGESELPADLENVLSIDALAHRLTGRSSAALVELLPGPDRMCASGPEGAFAHQIVMPFVRSPTVTSPPPRRVAAGRAPRRFPPGSDWLSVKLFTGTSAADRVLDDAAAVVHRVLTARIADRWFFIRYGEPDWHLRLRVHGDRERLLHEALPALNAAAQRLVDAGQVWRVEIDTYEREVERYGGDQAIELAELIFHADSEAVLSILRAVRGDGGAALRWRAALAGIDLLLEDFGFTLDEKQAICGRARESYGTEFGAGRAFQRELSRRYRDERAGLEAVLDRTSGAPPALRPVDGALRGRSQAIAPLLAALRRLADDDRLSAPLEEIAMSFAHMHVNRVLRCAPRVQELVLYELLDRLYTSRAARVRG